MQTLKVKKDPETIKTFEQYPEKVQGKLYHLRTLIIETAKEMDSVGELEETLKWGEPSYLTKHGSTIRIDWKSRTPDQYAMYFKCTSKLVPTFKYLFGKLFTFEKNRAIVFNMVDKIPVKELKICIELALKYHLVKNEVNLGK